MIPFKKRGMYQALQNSMFGFGAICGASFGGSIADSIGWFVHDFHPNHPIPSLLCYANFPTGAGVSSSKSPSPSSPYSSAGSSSKTPVKRIQPGPKSKPMSTSPAPCCSSPHSQSNSSASVSAATSSPGAARGSSARWLPASSCSPFSSGSKHARPPSP